MPDTPKSPKSPPKSPSGSKPGTPTKSTRRSSVKSPKSRQLSGKSGKSSKSVAAEGDTSAAPIEGVLSLRKARGDELEDSGTQDPPEDVKPLFLSGPTQQIFGLVTDTDVTIEEPFKFVTKAEILKDMQARAAVSDFSVVKKIINEYPADELLLAYDPFFKFGENFYLALSEDAKSRILYVPPEEGEDGAEIGEDGEPIDTTVYEYHPTESKPWVSLGSEMEVEEMNIVNNRPLVVQRVSRKRRMFGAPIEFTDRSSAGARDGYLECLTVVDGKFDLVRKETETAVQAVKEYSSRDAQTQWPYPTNATTQYVPREFDHETRQQLANSAEVAQAVEASLPRFDLTLQHNEVMNPFLDDWKELAVEETTFGNKADSYLKEYQSFTDLKNSKNKTVTCVDWHPQLKGIVGVSYGERCTFDDRIDHLSKIQVTPSLILIWSFADPIQPQLILEAPDDINVFKFCPTDPNTIAGGCINGQIVLWDITQYQDRLKKNKRAKINKANTMNTLAGYIDESMIATPVVQYCAVSSIEMSHKNWITDLQWFPDHMEISRQGQIYESHKRACTQLVTAACDGYLMFWDIKAPKGVPPPRKQDNPMRVSNMYKHLDLTWKPLMRIPISLGEGQDLSPYVFNYAQTQGDRSLLPKPDPEEEAAEEERKKQAEALGLRPSSPRDKKTLEGAPTKYFVGSEDGQLIYLDWTLEKDTDSGKLVHKAPEYLAVSHDGPLKTICRSPFLNNIILSIGGWNWCLWDESNPEEGTPKLPLLQSRSHDAQLTCGQWSPTRAGVFFISKSDGTVDVWDLLDKTSDPVLTQSVTPHGITKIYPQRISGKQQLLGIGDSYGTLHVLEVPWVFRQAVSKESKAFESYLEREKLRLAYMNERRDNRMPLKRSMDAEVKRIQQAEAELAKVTEEEKEAIASREYQEFLDLEGKLQLELGLREEKFDLEV